MEQAIRTIIEAIPRGLYFDSHYVIDRLKESVPDIYSAYRNSLSNANDAQAHGLLAQHITPMSDIAEQIADGHSHSVNVNGSGSPCALWRRR